MLAAQSISVMRGGRMVIAQASCHVAAGELVAICGPNGAGKSSLLAALAGTTTPAAGSVSMDGRALGELSARERARVIGYLPQQGEAAWDVSVETLVSLGRLPWRATPGRAARAARAGNRAAIEVAMQAMELLPLADRALSTLSGGEKARAMTARVLAGEPRVILADEPFASLDIGHALTLARLMRDQARAGRAVGVVMHDLAMAMNLADRVIVLSHGTIAATGHPQDALSPRTIAKVWGVEADWLGEPGHRALSCTALT